MASKSVLDELYISALKEELEALRVDLKECKKLLELEREHNQVLARGLAEIAVIVRSKA